jgi:hypothetical protein
MGAERERVKSVGRLEDGLRQAGGSGTTWGPYVSEQHGWCSISSLATVLTPCTRSAAWAAASLWAYFFTCPVSVTAPSLTATRWHRGLAPARPIAAGE